MSKRPKRIEGGLFDVRDIVHDERRRWEFAIALTCALDGKTPEEVIRQIEEDQKEERKRVAKYGPPLDERQKPRPQEAECADCGKIAYPFGGFQQYLTDIPQHRWVQRYRCMHCHDEQQRRKWMAIGRDMQRRRDGERP